MVKCPICPKNHRGFDGLFVHLMKAHGKNEVVKALLEMMANQKLTVEKHHTMPNGAFQVTRVSREE